jgi:hypothetical protein
VKIVHDVQCRSNGLTKSVILFRRQWIKDSQAHVGQVLESLQHADRGLPGLNSGEPGLRSEVNIAQEQQMLAIEQQDLALDRIEKAAQRVGHLGLEIHRELGVCCHSYDACFCKDQRQQGVTLMPLWLLCGMFFLLALKHFFPFVPTNIYINLFQ